MAEQLRIVSYKDSKIEYYLTRKQVKNINLRIRGSDGTVRVSANQAVDEKFIDEFVVSNGEHILKTLEKLKIRSNEATKLKGGSLCNGDELLLLGKKYIIRVEKSGKNSVVHNNTYFILRLNNTESYTAKRQLLDYALNNLRNMIYNEIIDKNFPVFEKLGKERPKLIIKSSVSRWGYCQPEKGIIMMNEQLISVPKPLIEYLVLHELTHLIYPNHSRDFWNFMSKLMPDCRIRRKQLQRYGFLLEKRK